MDDTVEKEVQKTTQVTTAAPQQVITTTKKVEKEPEVKTEHPQKVFEKKKTIFRSYQIIWYVLGIIEVILAFRALLRLLGANSSMGFTKLIYTLSEPFAVPFFGVVEPTVSGVSVIEWSTYIAMLVYLIVAYGMVKFFQFVKPVTPEEVEQSVDAT